ncbi:hypothetical protein SAMN06298216_2776 [Spirosomataceae bacterium TFI 002]|nr:hypothetical protein SAMN06298216_2776 [Spirosomataceae bacterium TFI 002]
MAKYFTLLFMLFQSFSSLAQEEPYYEPVGKRTLENLKYLPNLETTQNRIYIATSGGTRYFGSKMNLSNDFFEAKRNTSLYWKAQLGYNFDDKWSGEFAFSKNPIYLKTSLSGLRNRQSSLNVNKGESFNEFQLRLKRKIIQVDKVAQKAGIFFTTGISYSPNLANRDNGLSQYVSPIFNGANIPPDTVLHEVRTRTSKHAFAVELGLELSGRVSDQLGVGLFVNTWIRPKGSMYNDLSYRVNSSEPQVFQQSSNALNLNAGILIYYNMLNWVKYRNNKSLLN